MNPPTKRTESYRYPHGDTPPETRRVQYEICRNVPLGRKIELTFSMCDTGRLLALSGLRMLHPEATEAQLQRMWARKHLGPELFEQVYGDARYG